MAAQGPCGNVAERCPVQRLRWGNPLNPAQKKKFIGIGTGLVVSVHRARAGCDHDLLFVVASRRGGAAAVAIAFSLATVAIVAVVVVICMGFWFF